MSVATKLLSTAAGMTGNIEKACIVLVNKWDAGSESISMEDPVSPGGSSTFSSILSAVSKVTSALFSTTSGTSTGAATYYVMFNPSSLRIGGRGGGREAKTNFSGSGSQVEMEEGNVRITLSVQLIFDRTSPSQSFLSDKLNTSTTAIATNVGSAILSGTGATTYSVKEDVEAFTAALHNPETREMIFCWGDMKYEGYLENVSANYTMFDPLGKPTRAEVGLSMVLYSSVRLSIEPEEEANIREWNNMLMWSDAIEEVFKSNTSLTSVTQKVGSLLNINL